MGVWEGNGLERQWAYIGEMWQGNGRAQKSVVVGEVKPRRAAGWEIKGKRKGIVLMIAFSSLNFTTATGDSSIDSQSGGGGRETSAGRHRMDCDESHQLGSAACPCITHGFSGISLSQRYR